MVDDHLLEGVDIIFHSHRWRQCWCWASWIQVRSASLELDRLLPYTEGCPNGWSRHASLKLKSKINEASSNYFLGENESVYFVRAFWGVYIELMALSLSCNDDCMDCQCRYCGVDWAVTSSKGNWLVPFAYYRAKISGQCSWLSI